MLEVKNLSVTFNNKELLHNITMTVNTGARHRLAGQNGSGKSTLVNTIMGDPSYTITNGQIILNTIDITNLTPTQRSLYGLFLGTQNVPEIPGLTILSFLKHSLSAHYMFNNNTSLPMGEFLTKLEKAQKILDIPKDWLNRYINVGFSGGEKKRIMLLQLVLMNPKIAILDEPDAGTDKNMQKLIIETIHNMKDTTFLFISHQDSFTAAIKPTQTTILDKGKIVIQ